MSKTVMFIHGAWLTPASWDLFRDRFEGQGFQTLAPSWPFEDMPIDELRSAPDPSFPQVTIDAIVDHYESRILALPDPPVLVGHSFGGLFVQMLLDRGLGAAGIALDPVPIRGVAPTLRALRSALPALFGWGSWRKMVTMSFERFAADFAQTLPPAEMRQMYDRYVVPTPGRLYWQAALGIGTKVDVRNPTRAPLLLVAGDEDRTIEPAMVRAAYRRQMRSPSLTAFRAFAGRSHFLIAEPGWEEIADYAMDWTTHQAEPAASSRAPSGGERGHSPPTPPNGATPIMVR